MQKSHDWWKDLYNTHERIGPVLKNARRDAGLTLKVLADFIRCSPQSLGYLERGQFGSLKLVDAYATALGLDFGKLGIGVPAGMHSINERKPVKKSPRKIAAEAAAAIKWSKKRRIAARAA